MVILMIPGAFAPLLPDPQGALEAKEAQEVQNGRRLQLFCLEGGSIGLWVKTVWPFRCLFSFCSKK